MAKRITAAKVVHSLGKIASYVEANWQDFEFGSKKEAYQFVLNLDKQAERLERTASEEDYWTTEMNDVSDDGPNTDDVLDYDSDEDFMETFESPSEWESGDEDESEYMEFFDDSNFDTVRDSFEEEMEMDRESSVQLRRLAHKILRIAAAQDEEAEEEEKEASRNQRSARQRPRRQAHMNRRAENVRSVARDFRVDEDVAEELINIVKTKRVRMERDADKVLRHVNSLIDGFGVEALYPDYGQKAVGLYVNTGDAYAATMTWDPETSRFALETWGDLLERWERENL